MRITGWWVLLPCRPLRIEVISIDLTGDCWVPLSSPSSILEKTSCAVLDLGRGTRLLLGEGPRSSLSFSLSNLSRSLSALFCYSENSDKCKGSWNVQICVTSKMVKWFSVRTTFPMPSSYLYFFAVLDFWYILSSRTHNLVCFDPFIISDGRDKDKRWMITKIL